VAASRMLCILQNAGELCQISFIDQGMTESRAYC
jgi:hypothetical protein